MTDQTIQSAAQRQDASEPSWLERGVDERLEAARASQARSRERVEKMLAGARKPDVIDVRESAGKKEKAIPPTPEQMARVKYVEQPIHDKTPQGGQSLVGTAYRRVARFESVEGLSVDELRALRFYRAVFDASELSETKSALDIRPRGSGDGGALARIEQIAGASTTLRRIEGSVPRGCLATLRSVALHDADFKAVAIERFGGREVQRIDTGKRKAKVTTSIAPRSGRHRAVIRDEFMAAARSLVIITQPLMSTVRAKLPASAPAEEAAVAMVTAEAMGEIEPAVDEAPAIDPAFCDATGHMLPWAEIAAIIRSRLLENEA